MDIDNWIFMDTSPIFGSGFKSTALLLGALLVILYSSINPKILEAKNPRITLPRFPLSIDSDETLVQSKHQHIALKFLPLSLTKALKFLNMDSTSDTSSLQTTMPKFSVTGIRSPSSILRNSRPKTDFLTDAVVFFAGAVGALLLIWVLWSLYTSTNNPSFQLQQQQENHNQNPNRLSLNCSSFINNHPPSSPKDNPSPTFYDDPTLTYSIEKPIKEWDQKRASWLQSNPSFAGNPNRILLLTGSQSAPCRNPIGDHLLLRFFKNKVDYCRIHGYDIFYNNVLLHPKMFTFWAKLPLVRAAMIAHPEAEWIWWVDSDAAFTDMEFKLPLEKYKNHNLVVHGWEHEVYEKQSWTSLNAGVFLIRNCQWSLDFMNVWASMGPQSAEYENWGKVLRSVLPDKAFPESDDQSGLVYLLLKEKEKWGDKIYLESGFYFQGYWLEIVGNLNNIAKKYDSIEKSEIELRRRHAEKVAEFYGELREKFLKEAGNGRGSWRRPFITHFTGCQPCSGDHNKDYSGETCWNGMQIALNFADNQVLRNFGFVHPDLLDSSKVTPLPFT